MKLYFTLTSALGGCAAFLLGACSHLQVTHVAPGESVNVVLAKKPEVLRMPTPTPAPPAFVTDSRTRVIGPVVEPELPQDNRVERVGEAYSRGQFCLGAGKDKEAIEAFEEAVRIDPAFSEAWQHLAMLYEKRGDSKKALDAFRRAKKLARR